MSDGAKRALSILAAAGCFVLIPIGAAGFRWAIENAEDARRRARARAANAQMRRWYPSAPQLPEGDDEPARDPSGVEQSYQDAIAERARSIEI